ncbi:MAG: hypothetical protein JW984_00690 [Deltaproteobacteria bacterium]|uniref:Uncharacterized protein n=1 Tax=Candidatus Zymogenus saltonus TaxID=2844893 RepID=A0A9D8KBM2_9DELT|nr:hypothetical protein [Candidatus Zymogenus saltonus]
MIDDNPTLFDVPKIKLKRVMEDISILNLEGAKVKMYSLLRQYPENDDVGREAEILKIIESVMTEETTPSQLLSGFYSIKRHLNSISYQPEYLDDLEIAFFQRIVDAFGEEEIKPVQGYPAGFLLMKAGRFKDAEESLLGELDDPSLPLSKRARLLGYMGDLFFMVGDTEGGRSHYLKAVLADWRGIDKKNIVDEDVSALIAGTYIPEGEGGIWAAPTGHMLMVFRSGSFEDSDDLMDFYNEFIRLKSLAAGDDSEEVWGKLFYYALVIEENEDVFRSLKGMDKMALRKLMRELNSVLFKLHTKLSVSRRDGEADPGEDMVG